MKKILYAIALFILFAIWNVYGNPNSPNAVVSTASSSRYISPTPGKFPIIAWSPYNTYDSTHTPTRREFLTLTECGFNSVAILDDIGKIQRLLSRINGLPLSVIVNMGWFVNKDSLALAGRVVQGMRSYMNNHNINATLLGGYLVYDEPSLLRFPYLAGFHNAIQSADTSVMAYENLYPQPDSAVINCVRRQNIFSTDSTKRNQFKNYINAYCETIHPSVLSFDFYPIMQEREDSMSINFKDFYYDLALFAHMSKAKNIPFWAFCESMNVIYLEPNDSSSQYPQRPLPTEEFLRFEAFNALALGAQGIQYWTYAYHPSTSAGERYISALIDSNGNKTSAWYAAQAINREIASYDTVFLGANLETYFFVGDQYVRPQEVYRIVGRPGDFSVSRVRGKGALVSRLSNNGRTYIVVVNQDPINSTTLRFTYRKYCRLVVDSISGPIIPGPVVVERALPDSGWTTVHQYVTLAPSQYLIHRIMD